MAKKLLMVAGPNGAGKTTLTKEFILRDSKLYEFINADEIAKGLSPLNPEKVALLAGKLMIKRFKELLESSKSFAFETTAAGTNFVKHIKYAKSKGYEIYLIFLRLSNPDQAIKRVEQRVCQGGHHISKEVIIRRYYAGLKNLLDHYLELADTVAIVDNSGASSPRNLIVKKKKNHPVHICDKVKWDMMWGCAHGG